jgi:hypothetical protein
MRFFKKNIALTKRLRQGSVLLILLNVKFDPWRGNRHSDQNIFTTSK